MKYNPYDEVATASHRTALPPLPADTKYREQRKREAIFETLDEDDAYRHIAPKKSRRRFP